jgi:hypothetical protein
VRLIFVGMNGFARRAGTLVLRGGPSALFVGRASSHDSLASGGTGSKGEVPRSASRISPTKCSHTRISQMCADFAGVHRTPIPSPPLAKACPRKGGRTFKSLYQPRITRTTRKLRPVCHSCESRNPPLQLLPDPCCPPLIRSTLRRSAGRIRRGSRPRTGRCNPPTPPAAHPRPAWPHRPIPTSPAEAP